MTRINQFCACVSFLIYLLFFRWSLSRWSFTVSHLMFLWSSLGSGDEEEQPEQLMESVGFEEQEEYLQCFRCDLGFWDACYTTETNCSLGERCYTGRGKAGMLVKAQHKVWRSPVYHLLNILNVVTLSPLADSLDVKTLGCVKAEECGVETTVELFSNQTILVMTKHCCDTPFCNSAHKLPLYTFLYIAAVFLTTWHVTEDSAGS